MGLRFERALRFSHPIFGDVGQRLDEVGHRIGAGLRNFTAFAGCQPFGRGFAEVFQRAGDVDRKGFRVADQVSLGGCGVETGRFATLFSAPPSTPAMRCPPPNLYLHILHENEYKFHQQGEATKSRTAVEFDIGDILTGGT